MKVLKLNEWIDAKESSHFVPKNARDLREIIE